MKKIYALGFFDGVHLGHQALLQEACRLAGHLGCEPAVYTFLNHPEALLTGAAPKLICDVRERFRLLGKYGAKTSIGQPFDESMKNTPWDVFLESVPNAAGFVCGSDFRFGAKGAGTAEALKDWCERRKLACTIVPPQELDGVTISSAYNSTLLEQGSVRRAPRIMGNGYRIFGTVVQGQGLGRQLGTPTANIALDGNILLPRHGVYACLAYVDDRVFPAVANVGTRPTVGGETVTVEPWLLDFEGDLYGEFLALELVDFLRPEKKFDSLVELQAEILKNAGQTRRILEKY